jgi:hypothetical protein
MARHNRTAVINGVRWLADIVPTRGCASRILRPIATSRLLKKWLYERQRDIRHRYIGASRIEPSEGVAINAPRGSFAEVAAMTEPAQQSLHAPLREIHTVATQSSVANKDAGPRKAERWIANRLYMPLSDDSTSPNMLLGALTFEFGGVAPAGVRGNAKLPGSGSHILGSGLRLSSAMGGELLRCSRPQSAVFLERYPQLR